MKRKTINISEDSYKTISVYCKDNSFKIGSWAERILLQKIKEMEVEYGDNGNRKD